MLNKKHLSVIVVSFDVRSVLRACAYNPLTLFSPGAFCLLRLGGRGASEVPLYSFENAHPTATKIAHNNVLNISNF